MKAFNNIPTILTVFICFCFCQSLNANPNTDSKPLQIEDEITIDLDDAHNITHFKLLTADKTLLYEVEYDDKGSEITMDLSGIPNGKYYVSVTIEAGIEIFSFIEKI